MYGGLYAWDRRETIDNPYYRTALEKPSPLEPEQFTQAYFLGLLASPDVQKLSAKAAKLGKELPCAYDASVCDSNILAVVLGIPTVTFGPAGGNMHGDDEYGYAWQVKNCGEIYRRTVARLLAEQA